MRKIINRLRSRKGETLTETLIGMLIVSMASVVLVSGITAAIRVNERTKQASKDNQFKYEEVGTATSKNMTISGTGITTITIGVNEHVDDSDYVWLTPQ